MLQGQIMSLISEKGKKIALLFNKFLPKAQELETDAPAKVQTDDGTEDVESPKVTYRIRFKPPQDIFMRGIDPINLIVELGALGDCKVHRADWRYSFPRRVQILNIATPTGTSCLRPTGTLTPLRMCLSS